MTDAQGELIAPLQAFGKGLTAKFASNVPGQPEDQLKGPVETLLQQLGAHLGHVVLAKTESPVAGLKGRPDLGVAVAGLLTGHVELKAPGVGAQTSRFKGHDKEQWKKFQTLPNLLYTDGNEWALYRTGQRVGKVVRFSGDVTADGDSAATFSDAEKLGRLLQVFLSWRPIVPTSPKQLAELLAPLCRLLRADVLDALKNPSSNISQLKADWQTYLFPDADDLQFADAYAQTLAYALLLARLDGLQEIDTDKAAKRLRTGHALLGRVLALLADESAREEIDTAVSLLERVISAVDSAKLAGESPDPWLYFYEDFLAEYDPKLRKDRGVYYTPVQVVQTQVHLVAELLRDRFDKALAYASPEVVTLDPGVGTGTYPLAAIQYSLERVHSTLGAGAVQGYATELANNVHAFEILVGPYTVAHLRLSERILAAGGTLPSDGVRVYLTDTLESPNATPPGALPLLYKRLTDEHVRAQRVKKDVRVIVCIGNPPYDREERDPEEPAGQRKGGWVRYGDRGRGETPIFDSFVAPARAAKAGEHVKNLYNDYVYFWRWALWKVFESTDGPGIVSFITAASYLRGPGFVGMREVMRRIFDELWIIDLEGDNRGPRPTENVFAIQTPVAIAVGMRTGAGDPEAPAAVHYTKIGGTREEKLARLDGIRSLKDLQWQQCESDWWKPFLPIGSGDFFSWPLLTDLFPWQHSGVQFKRTWPIAPDEGTLARRWKALLSARDKRAAFREADRKVHRVYPDLFSKTRLVPIAQLPADTPAPEMRRYGFRSFDRQWVLADNRLADRMRPPLWRSQGDNQIYLTSLLTTVLGTGPAASVTAEVPDLHHFRGSFGGADVIPLFRDSDGTEANVTAGLLELLSTSYGRSVKPEDLLGYCYALLASTGYTDKFSEELALSSPRVPITNDADLFEATSKLGRELLWLHTFGARSTSKERPKGKIPTGEARCVKGVNEDPAAYPDSFSYDSDSGRLLVGDGVFEPVSQDVWNFSVSGLQVASSWLGYRMRQRAGRISSELDGIHPERWSVEFTTELLNLLWVLERTYGLQGLLNRQLESVVTSSIFSEDELPPPGPDEREPPSIAPEPGSQTQTEMDFS